MDDTANWICREQWAQHSKMIIGMDDDDVLQMIATKQAGGEQTDMVRQKVEDFRLRMCVESSSTQCQRVGMVMMLARHGGLFPLGCKG